MSTTPARRTTAVRRIEREQVRPFGVVPGGVQRVDARRVLVALRAVALACITPLLEKNANKTMGLDVPVVFSMSRVVVVAFATGMLRQLWKAGITSWPEATLSIAIVLALPMLGALQHVTPAEAVDVMKSLAGRFGVGEQRRALNLFTPESQEPQSTDNHWRD